MKRHASVISDLDYSSDTSDNDSNILSSSDDKMYKNVSKHKVVNIKGEHRPSLSDLNIKYLDSKKFGLIKETCNTTFYDMDALNNKDLTFIYNILLATTYIIFVDNNKLIKPKKTIFKKTHLTNTQFPGCTFLPYESLNMIKMYLTKLNNSVFNAELNDFSLYINEDCICHSIMFNEGEIIKNCLYKKMEITDTVIFIPVEQYNLKQTEYKLRGFCQIVEELGAKNINITFKISNEEYKYKKFNTKIGDDIEFIAGNLGLSSTMNNINSTNYNYDLTYPNNSTITLDEKKIKKKIKRNKFIVSDSIFRSNLELQYLVHSRCRYLIDKYSTVFTFDNTNIIDKTIYTNLKSHGIKLGFNYEKKSKIKNNIQIITEVSFVNLEECADLINGNSVSLDEVGFNHIIESLKYSSFETKGVYKIMNFIEMYIIHVFKHTNSSHYDEIHYILNKIKKELTIEEYAKLLCNYFSINSQWIHFTHFIDLLCKKSQSYDKLGYIIMISNIDNSLICDNIIKFIQQVCVERKIENKFWKMLQPHNKSLKYDLENKLIAEYDFINNHSWYNMEMLIHCIESYNTEFNINENEALKQYIYNMEVGYKYWEYYTNILPFILNHARSLYYNNNDDNYISPIFEKSLNIDSFLVSKINNMCDLKQFIEKKISRLREGMDIKNSITYPIEVNDFAKEFEKNCYFYKKMQYVMKTRTVYNMKKLLNLSDVVIRDHIANNFISKLLTYNEKLNIKNIPKNYIGFEMILDNYNSGIPEEEFKKNIIPFICSHYENPIEIECIKKQVDINNFNIYATSYFEMVQYINKILENID
jgi:hypothetical protein